MLITSIAAVATLWFGPAPRFSSRPSVFAGEPAPGMRPDRVRAVAVAVEERPATMGLGRAAGAWRTVLVRLVPPRETLGR